ncbi:hypothetical protein Bca4012_025860 [Brassica carinata]
MGRVFRIWRGDWKKNSEGQWNFLPNHQDYGFTMYMDSPETVEVIDATIRENYMLGSTTPNVITYGMPDWMMFPSGPSPPMTIASTADLVRLMIRRPPHSEITLLVTFGAKDVAEFQFLSRTDFTIGSSTYVVGARQDERARAKYERLVLGERLLTSEMVMEEIFGEEEMLILHRVALEMGYADRNLRPQASSSMVQRMEIIQLDDDDEMMDVSQMGVIGNGGAVVGPVGGTGNGTSTGNGGAVVPIQAQPLAQIPAADAPSVLWDVGMDLLDYPEYYNAQRDGRLVTEDSAFWNELIEENLETMEGVYLIANNNESELVPREALNVAGPIICSQFKAAKAAMEIGVEVKGAGGVDGSAGTTQEKLHNPLPGPTLTLTLGIGSEEPDAHTRTRANLENTSSEGSETEGGF